MALPTAAGPWAIDSGGFTVLRLFGAWQTPAMQYSSEVRRWHDEVGGLEWAAIQDWMCEPFMLEKTRLTVGEHQRRTVHSWHLLRRLAPDMPWVPVLQGWEPDDYLAHVEQYRESGSDLASLPLVGVGSVCRRQGTDALLAVLRPLAALGLKLHGFGVKIDGLRNGGAALLESADSLAWSRAARYDPPLPGCRHKTCANCLPYALRWREKVLRAVTSGRQRHRPVLFA
jgi:hypothetical protein